MSTARVIEVVGQSTEGFESAVKEAVRSVSEKIKNIKCVDVIKWTADVENGQLVRFRADCKILYVEE
jgi:flavin-binding protein dodecin